MTKFNVGALDLSGFSDADLAPPARRLRNPGVYRTEVVDYVLRTENKNGVIKDGAGKRWASLQLNLKVTGSANEHLIGQTITTFFDVPVETLTYTSAGGRVSKIKTQIFVNLIKALTGVQPTMAQIQSSLNKLDELLTGGQLTVKVGYDGDHINYVGKDDAGMLQYNILLKDGSAMLNADGEPVTAVNSDGRLAREELETYYRTVRGFRPSQFGVIGFRSASAELSSQEG